MKIGIVILNYNDSKTTVTLLEKVKNYRSIDQIVVVDNNSSDDSFQILRKYQDDRLAIIKAEKNNGYGAGNNIGARYLASKGIDYIVISNPDIIFDEDDIQKLCSSFKNEKVAIVAPTIKESGGLNRGWKFKGAAYDSLTNINFFGRYFKEKMKYNKDYYKGIETVVDITSGCFFVIRRDVFEKIGYFDENIFLYYEENVLAKKVQKIGMKIIVRNDVTIIHNHSVTINKSLNKISKFKTLTRSQRYYQKNYNNAGFFGMFLLYITYVIALGISYVILFINKAINSIVYKYKK